MVKGPVSVNDVPVPPMKVRFVVLIFVLVTLAKLASVAERLVEVTETAERPSQRKLAVPRKYVASVPGRKSPVDVPPANWMAFVVVAPFSVTSWRVRALAAAAELETASMARSRSFRTACTVVPFE